MGHGKTKKCRIRKFQEFKRDHFFSYKIYKESFINEY